MSKVVVDVDTPDRKDEQEKHLDIGTDGEYEVVPDEGKTLSRVTLSVDTPDVKPEMEKTLSVTENGTHTVIPDAGYVLKKVVVEVDTPVKKEEQEKTIDANADGTYTVEPDDGKVLSKVTVKVDTPDVKPEMEKTLSGTENGTHTVTPDTGYVLKKVEVEVNVPTPEPKLQTKTVTPTTSKQTIKPDSGYDGLSQVDVNAMPSATQATPSITVSSAGLITAKATQSAGYVASGTKSATKQLTVQAGKTVTPTTSNQTAVASGRYTTGAITVKGDANLKAENIKSGVSIFGVTGSYAGSTEDLDSVITELETKVATLNTTLDGKASGGGSVEICTVTFNVGGSGIDYLCATIMSGGRFDTCFYNGSGVNSENSMTIENVVCGTPIAINAAVPAAQVSFSDGGELIDMGNAFFTIKAPTVAGANTTISIVSDM